MESSMGATSLLAPPPPGRPSDHQAAEAQLKDFSRRIEGKLRAQFADRRLRRMLRPMRLSVEKSQPVAFWIPSKWSLLIAGTPLLLLAPRIRAQVPIVGHWPWLAVVAVAVAIALAFVFEVFVLPKLSLAKYQFDLMRLEHRQDEGTFPDGYLRAPVLDSRSGFGSVQWKSARGVEPGDIVVAVNDAQGNGVALIPLRTEGRLPVVVWFRDLYQEDVLSPLSDEIKALAQAFDESCELFLQTGHKAERSRVLRSKRSTPTLHDPEQAWRNTILPAETKHRLMAIAADFTAGKPAAPSGLLLFGPPGTGKTLAAKALAESIGCAFFPLTLPDLKATYVGESGERVRDVWNKALAEPKALIFVDESDGLFSRRGSINTDRHTEDVVNAFIAQWDGFSKQTTVLVVGATNRQDLIDPAVLSRFDEQVKIGLPDAIQRKEILHAALRGLNASAELPATVGELTEGLSGRDLAGIAKRLVRDIDHGSTLDHALIERHASALRRQGSTETSASARWDTLVLPDPTMKDLKATAGMLAHAAVFQDKGISVPRALLLYGPPGTGKTQIARTLANETGLRFIAASTADIKQGWLGHSGQKVRELFERARESAPALLFIDEIDIIAGTRGSNDSMQTEIIGQLLQEMDGAKANPQHVFVLAATNRIDQIDPAVLSRLPKQIEIPLPDSHALRRLLKVMLANKPLAFDPEQEAMNLAAHAEGWSGRELRSWIEQAEQNAVIRAMENGDPASISLQLEDFRDTSLIRPRAAGDAQWAP
jgi:SpoVK/Ycf46/Vps4 family AAA+-type ATPase